MNQLTIGIITNICVLIIIFYGRRLKFFRKLVDIFPSILALIALYTYTFIYLICIRFYDVLMNSDEDFFPLIFSAIQSPSFYQEITVWIAIAGFYQLLVDNYSKGKDEKNMVAKHEITLALSKELEEKTLEIERLKAGLQLLQTELDSCPHKRIHHKNKELWRH